MYKIILASRYLVKRHITYFAMLAVALCVFIVVVVMTVLTGLVRDFKQKNHQFTGDCIVGTRSLVGFAYYEDFMKILEQTDFVESASAVIKSFALVSPSWTEQSLGLEIIGIDPVEHSKTTNFGQTLYYRKNDVTKAFEPVFDTNLPGCVLGIDVGYRLNVALAPQRSRRGGYFYSDRLDKTSVSISCVPLTAKGAPAKADLGLINTQNFYYSDYSHSGLARVDSSSVYLPFSQAQQLCGMDGPEKRASAIHIKFKPDVKLQTGCKKVTSLWQDFKQAKESEKQAYLLDTVTAQSWKEYRRSFIAPMEKEQAEVIVMFALVGITTVFIILVVFYMIISHKRKDIGVLKSVGVSNSNIILLFLSFASLVGLLGSGIGTFAGWLFLSKINEIENWLFQHFEFQLWDRTIYAIGDIPNQIDFTNLVIIILSAVAACLVGALVPSWQAAKLNPVETLHVSQL
jgi:ABC-type lipoprotein release transport system permease subunit